MNTNKSKVTFTYELKQEVKGFSVKCLDWDCIVTQGETIKECKKNATEVTEMFLELLAEGKVNKNKLPKITELKKMDNRFNLSFASPFISATKEELLSISYGPKGTKKREQAEIKIKVLAKNISFK